MFEDTELRAFGSKTAVLVVEIVVGWDTLGEVVFVVTPVLLVVFVELVVVLVVVVFAVVLLGG